MASVPAYSKDYRANKPEPELKPTHAELEKYNKEFYGILHELTNKPFFTEPHAHTGRKVEGKRFPALTPAEDDSLSTEQKEYFATLGDRPKIGPTNPWTRTPEMTKIMNQQLQYFNTKSEVPPMAKEIGILVTARFFNSDFEWYAHEPPALHSGVSQAACDAIRENARPPVAAMTETENTIYTFCWSQYNSEKRRVDQHTWTKVRALLGERGCVELLGVMSYYSWVSMSLNTDEFPIPTDTPFHL